MQKAVWPLTPLSLYVFILSDPACLYIAESTLSSPPSENRSFIFKIGIKHDNRKNSLALAAPDVLRHQ